MKDKKVYCIDCEYILGINNCRHTDNITYESTPLRKESVFASIDSCNKYNDCCLFVERKDITVQHPFPSYDPLNRKLNKKDRSKKRWIIESEIDNREIF